MGGWDWLAVIVMLDFQGGGKERVVDAECVWAHLCDC